MLPGQSFDEVPGEVAIYYEDVGRGRGEENHRLAAVEKTSAAGLNCLASIERHLTSGRWQFSPISAVEIGQLKNKIIKIRDAKWCDTVLSTDEMKICHNDCGQLDTTPGP